MEGGMDSITQNDKASCPPPARNQFKRSATCCVAREHASQREAGNGHKFHLPPNRCIHVIANVSLNGSTVPDAKIFSALHLEAQRALGRSYFSICKDNPNETS